MFQDQYYSFSLKEFAEILGVPCEGACVFTDKWALYELANGLPGDGPYQTFLPSLDDIITLVRVYREGPVTRVRHKNEIDVIEYQVLTREIDPTFKDIETILRENVFRMGEIGIMCRLVMLFGPGSRQADMFIYRHGAKIAYKCAFIYDAREPHFSALKRVLCYIRALDFELQLYASSTGSLVAYSVVGWDGFPSIMRSTTDYCVFLGDNLLSWYSKWQHTLSISSAEAEYRDVANVVVETVWLHNLLLEPHTPLLSATLVYCDNVSTIYMTTNHF
ncbi:ribonuclease H-like domain-containing protein [Tanacetum coccineum]